MFSKIFSGKDSRSSLEMLAHTSTRKLSMWIYSCSWLWNCDCVLYSIFIQAEISSITHP